MLYSLSVSSRHLTCLENCQGSVGHGGACRAHAVGAACSSFLFCIMSTIYKQRRSKARLCLQTEMHFSFWILLSNELA